MPTVAEALALAVAHHQAGRLSQAEQIYRQILAVDPQQSDSLHYLGVLAMQSGQYEVAEQYIRRAIAICPGQSAYYANLALVCQATRQLDRAESCFRQAVQLAPGNAGAYSNLGMLLKERGKPEAAVDCFQHALRLDPDSPGVLCQWGAVLVDLGRAGEALPSFRRALAVEPGNVAAQLGLANALATLGKTEEAIAGYQQILQAHPEESTAWCQLGTLLQGQRRLTEAVACFRRTLELRPDYAEAHNNLGVVLQEQGNLDDAISCYQGAVKANPELLGAHYNLGNAWNAKWQPDLAASCYQRVLQSQPDHRDALLGLARSAGAGGYVDDAVACYRRLLAAGPDPSLRFELATLLPMIYDGVEHLEAWRRRFIEGVESLWADGLRLDPIRDYVAPVFSLAYHGLNDRAIYERIAGLLMDSSRDLRANAGRRAPDGRIHVGLLSCFFRQHSVGELWRGIIARLSRRKFAVTVFTFGRSPDAVSQFIEAHADRYVVLPRDLDAARQCVADAGLDVLIYTDLGTDAAANALAVSRLAAVQCNTWGHPVTSGLPTMDYYISSELLETADSAEHYTEKLVRLKSLGVYAYRPPPPQSTKTRADFELPAGKHVYGCLQSLFKLHPAFDATLGDILRRDPQGILLLVGGRSAHWLELTQARLSRSMADVAERVQVIPEQKLDDYMRLATLVDVLLVPSQFGGGKTSYDAFALGVPVVTLPSPFLRGRITYGLYRTIDVLDCVAHTAAEYVEIAVRLATDRDWRRAVSEKIVAGSSRLFEDQQAIEELEEFLQEAVAAAPRV
jgi:predicted O-linked N-acetylglucosamine transferase (SPINDLY family)